MRILLPVTVSASASSCACVGVGVTQSKHRKEADFVIIMMICMRPLSIVRPSKQISIEMQAHSTVRFGSSTQLSHSLSLSIYLSGCLSVLCVIILTIYFAQLTQLPTHIHYAELPGSCA